MESPQGILSLESGVPHSQQDLQTKYSGPETQAYWTDLASTLEIEVVTCQHRCLEEKPIRLNSIVSDDEDKQLLATIDSASSSSQQSSISVSDHQHQVKVVHLQVLSSTVGRSDLTTLKASRINNRQRTKTSMLNDSAANNDDVRSISISPTSIDANSNYDSDLSASDSDSSTSTVSTYVSKKNDEKERDEGLNSLPWQMLDQSDGASLESGGDIVVRSAMHCYRNYYYYLQSA